MPFRLTSSTLMLDFALVSKNLMPCSFASCNDSNFLVTASQDAGDKHFLLLISGQCEMFLLQPFLKQPHPCLFPLGHGGTFDYHCPTAGQSCTSTCYTDTEITSSSKSSGAELHTNNLCWKRIFKKKKILGNLKTITYLLPHFLGDLALCFNIALVTKQHATDPG